MRLCLQWLDGAGEGWAKACLDGELRFAPVPEVRPQGRRSRCDGASEGRIFTTKARRSALRLPSKGGDQLKAQLARRRENEKPWLFRIRIWKFLARRPTHTPPSSSRKRGPIPSVVVMRKVSALVALTRPIITTEVMGPRLRGDDSGVGLASSTHPTLYAASAATRPRA